MSSPTDPILLRKPHWPSRLLARELGVSNVTVAKVWKDWAGALQPWRSETFKSGPGGRQGRTPRLRPGPVRVPVARPRAAQRRGGADRTFHPPPGYSCLLSSVLPAPPAAPTATANAPSANGTWAYPRSRTGRQDAKTARDQQGWAEQNQRRCGPGGCIAVLATLSRTSHVSIHGAG